MEREAELAVLRIDLEPPENSVISLSQMTSGAVFKDKLLRLTSTHQDTELNRMEDSPSFSKEKTGIGGKWNIRSMTREQRN